MAQIANLAWSYAKLGFGHGPLIDALSAAALRRITQGSMQALAKTAWAVECCCTNPGTHTRFLRSAVSHCPALADLDAEVARARDEVEGGLTSIDLANTIVHCGLAVSEVLRWHWGGALLERP
uniref:Uncharacterized protein n=1 Tax=Pyrodinium bahamense TaxID=73915 RepID=A0A7R9ZXR6_9DINO